ncbi:MAG: FAD-dependent oxidoreductase [Anaerolineae bacterium]
MVIKPKPRVVVVGGGFGGLETAFYLRKRLLEHVDITLISDTDYFLFKPNLIYVPFGLTPESLKIPLIRPASRKNIALVNARVVDVDPAKQEVLTDKGDRYGYDYLVLATGAIGHPEEIEGLKENAFVLWTPQEMQRLGRALQDLQVSSAKIPQILFLVPQGSHYVAPLYEMVFMIDTWLRRKGVRRGVNMVWTTHESKYLESFGVRMHELLLPEFAERDIRHYNHLNVIKVEKGRVVYHNGDSYPYDMLITFPPYLAATHFASLPADERGFVPTEPHTRRVRGFDNVYVAGDGGDFPLKQGFAAFTQADAIGEDIASRILGETPRFGFKPFGMVVMEHLNKATFAQVPLQTMGGVRVIDESPDYKTGTSALWRLGKMMMGAYLPWRFNAGEPLRSGLAWESIEAGRKMLSDVLAR